MKTDHSKIGAGAFGVVHRAVAVGIREGEDQVMLMDERIPRDGKSDKNIRVTFLAKKN